MSFGQVALGLVIWSMAGTAMAGDGATEALELRLHAELAIAEEATNGNPKLAGAMRELLPGLLVEHLVTRDETITLDTVDAAFIDAQFEQAALMEEPGIAMALDVFAGPGTGYEYGIRTSLANLADFKVKKEGKVSGKALDAHERVIEHHLAKLEAIVGDRIDDEADRLADLLDRLADQQEKLADATVDAVKDAADAAADAAQDAADSNNGGGNGGGQAKGKGKKK